MAGESARKIRIAVGLSGGVDSSVAALLLKEAGFSLLGVYLKCYWNFDGCRSDADRASAARVAGFLGIPFEVWDFEREYRMKVVGYFYREYKASRTPNPDIVCNREIKFGLFLKEALNRGFDFTATGHYAGCGLMAKTSKKKDRKGVDWPFIWQKNLDGDNLEIKLIRNQKFFDVLMRERENKEDLAGKFGNSIIFGGVDRSKDQSYFLYDIDKMAIGYSLYPLFGVAKSEVRRLALTYKLPTASRPDSRGICFIGEVNVQGFLKERIKEHLGEVVDSQGRVIGRHRGVEFYTVGQRRGFEVGRALVAARSLEESFQTGVSWDAPSTFAPPQPLAPLYVIGKDIEKNRLVVGAGEECKREAFTISKLKNQSSNLNLKSEKLFVRIRHLGELIPCEIQMLNAKCQMLNVKLAWPVFGVAPGQSAVFYRKRLVDSPVIDRPLTAGQFTKEKLEVWEVVGGGVIE